MSSTILKIEVEKASASKIGQVDFENLTFGSIFTDHMLVCDYKDGEWQTARIMPYGPISLDPSAKVFHYGQAVFEGLKAYKGEDDSIWLFRPDENQIRMNKSCVRLQIPEIPKEVFFDGLETLLKLDKEWIKKGEGNSLYIRPFIIATEGCVSASPSTAYKFIIICSPAQSYFKKGMTGVKVLFAEKYSRAANGGVGFAKCAGNYAGQFYPTHLANKEGYQQVLWTDASNHENLEEAGVMNVFFRIGDKLLTAPTSDRILDGVTRKSVIEIAKDEGIDVEVRTVTVSEIIEAAKAGTLKEMFGSGTAAVISPIAGFGHKGEHFDLPQIENGYASLFKKRITDIQYNKAEDKFGWRYKVEE